MSDMSLNIFNDNGTESVMRHWKQRADVLAELIKALKDIEIRAQRIRERPAIVTTEAFFIERIAREAIRKTEQSI